MSLLQRMERAQKAKEAAEAAKNGSAPAATPDTPSTAQTPPEPTAVAPVPVSTNGNGNGSKRAPVPVGPARMGPATPTGLMRPAAAPAREDLIREVRIRLQGEVVGAFKTLLDAKENEVHERIELLVDRVIAQGGFAVAREERERLVEEMVHDVTGFGPLEPLLADPTITEVVVNGPDHIYIERKGKIERIDSVFLNDQHVLRVIDRIITPLGRRIDESSPRVDARLPDGSRVNAVIEPLSLVGPVITVRKFSKTPYTVDDLIKFGTATPDMFAFLQACIEARLNMFVSGGTGSGKTTTLNVLSSFIPNDERIVTIEDAAELQLRQDHVITLESRPPNLEGEGEITIRNLLRNALHMRPDRIIVGECRAGEALDMLQAMTTGHDGSLSTGHANSPKDMLRRLETMVLMTGYQLPLRAIREQMASAVDIIVHTARLKDGSRKIVNITEVYGVEDDEILTHDIFRFVQTGYHDGRIEGSLQPTGVRPTFMAQFKRAGVELPPGEFGIPPEDPENPVRPRKSRFGARMTTQAEYTPVPRGDGKAVVAGGMVYVSSIGPVDPETGEVVTGSIKEQTRRCMANLSERLQAAGTSMDRVVWANWSLKEASDFDEFNEEWNRWFPGDPPLGQLTLMPPLQRRAGFGVTLGVIATLAPIADEVGTGWDG
ncbi:MAG TPA: ATPase, T2SS/T4P/T4SS family [Candidatus Limnocylindrales bacterium]|nr:ATPase, T2SS/T4P/T4SS family [Candidatus Limnocylindrales bacterium]